MHRAKGFLSNDNQFFEDEDECRLHECRTELEQYWLDHSINPEQVFGIIEDQSHAIQTYLSYFEKIKAKARAEGAKPDPGGSQT